MHIGILGSGIVAQTLAAGFLTHGHAVFMGTRDPAKLKDWHRGHSTAKLGSFADAVTGLLHNEWTHAFKGRRA